MYPFHRSSLYLKTFFVLLLSFSFFTSSLHAMMEEEDNWKANSSTYSKPTSKKSVEPTNFFKKGFLEDTENPNDKRFQSITLINPEDLEKIQGNVLSFIDGFGQGIIDGLEIAFYNLALHSGAHFGKKIGEDYFAPAHVIALSKIIRFSSSQIFYYCFSMITPLQSWAQTIASLEGIINKSIKSVDNSVNKAIHGSNLPPKDKEQLVKGKDYVMHHMGKYVSEKWKEKVLQYGFTGELIESFRGYVITYFYKGTGYNLAEKSEDFQKTFDPLYWPIKALDEAMDKARTPLETLYLEYLVKPATGWYCKNAAQYFVETDVQGRLREYNTIARNTFEYFLNNKRDEIKKCLSNTSRVINQFNGILTESYLADLNKWIANLKSLSSKKGRNLAIKFVTEFCKPMASPLQKLTNMTPLQFVTIKSTPKYNLTVRWIMSKTVPYVKKVALLPVKGVTYFLPKNTSQEKTEKTIQSELGAAIRELEVALKFPISKKMEGYKMVPLFEESQENIILNIDYEKGKVVSKACQNISECLQFNLDKNVQEKLKAALQMLQQLEPSIEGIKSSEALFTQSSSQSMKLDMHLLENAEEGLLTSINARDEKTPQISEPEYTYNPSAWMYEVGFIPRPLHLQVKNLDYWEQSNPKLLEAIRSIEAAHTKSLLKPSFSWENK